MAYQSTNPYDGSVLATFDDHAQNLKKTTLELGGSDAFAVLADTDVDPAVSSRMGNSGQACTASKRFIVVEPLADRFLDKCAQAMGRFMAGDPLDARTTLAPLASERALATLLDQVGRAVAAGARVVMGGSRIDTDGAFMQPTILTGIAATNPACAEEFFGPVALFFRVAVEGLSEALRRDVEPPGEAVAHGADFPALAA